MKRKEMDEEKRVKSREKSEGKNSAMLNFDCIDNSNYFNNPLRMIGKS